MKKAQTKLSFALGMLFFSVSYVLFYFLGFDTWPLRRQPLPINHVSQQHKLEDITGTRHTRDEMMGDNVLREEGLYLVPVLFCSILYYDLNKFFF